jgi:hypothetical protein
MARSLTAKDRSRLIRLASTLPVGSPQRKAILSSLGKTPSHRKVAGNSPLSNFVYKFLESIEKDWVVGESERLGHSSLVAGETMLSLSFSVSKPDGITITAEHLSEDVWEEDLGEIKLKLEKFFGCKFILDYTEDGYSYFHQASVLK